MYLLGIDLGTTGCKSVVFDISGNIMAQCYIEYELIIRAGGLIEQDAGLWWQLVKETVLQCVKDLGNGHDRIMALSVSSQGIAFVPVGRRGETLCNAISWLDARASLQMARLTDAVGEREIFRITGKRAQACYTLPKLLWLRENMPEAYGATYKFLMGLDFIVSKLAGKFITDHTMASGTMAYNITEYDWDGGLLELFNVDCGRLPDVLSMGTCLGTILPDVADELGLNRNVKVVLGAQDQKCAAIGVGIQSGIAAVSLGTATAVSTISSVPVFDPAMRIPSFCLYRGRWMLESVVGTTGSSLKWVKNSFFPELSYPKMDSLAEESQIGSGGIFFYPHLEGASSPFWLSGIKGFLYGFGLSSVRGDIVRSVMEGVAFQIRINLDIHEELNGTVRELRLFGGGSNSGIWCRIIANVTGKTVRLIHTPEAANLGAAILAGIGAGIYRSIEDNIPKDLILRKSYEPEAAAVQQYNAAFEQYLLIQDKIMSA